MPSYPRAICVVMRDPPFSTKPVCTSSQRITGAMGAVRYSVPRDAPTRRPKMIINVGLKEVKKKIPTHASSDPRFTIIIIDILGNEIRVHMDKEGKEKLKEVLK